VFNIFYQFSFKEILIKKLSQQKTLLFIGGISLDWLEV